MDINGASPVLISGISGHNCERMGHGMGRLLGGVFGSKPSLTNSYGKWKVTMEVVDLAIKKGDVPLLCEFTTGCVI